MYKAKLWDEDKWNIHSTSYSNSKYTNIFSEDKKEDKKYHEQRYGAKEKSVGSDYLRREEHKEKEESKADIFENLEEEKNEKVLNEEELPLKAAKQIFNEAKFESKKMEAKKDDKTIDDAIKQAIEQEKKVIIAND